ncbi:MAG: XrtA/PEP-CTERM system exopolysaccharide export protein [Methylohalobius sp. ZOD2]|uniref:XrtA/PEP-CTERM system exopolysaccharide export protein n=1 Tax=Methylohalobius crimeensis TaxID=244365 RepID=UPI0003B70588|nr:XrtA/PEP-CTERM system exopolysaccharide export protein [Methylohalobius crimeensis]MBN2700670.1 polysaccharide export protein [Methylothermaceae bacterium]
MEKNKPCFRKFKFAGFLAVLLIVLYGCSPYPPLNPRAEPPADYTYIIGPGDSLEMFVWGNPEITRTVVVRPDGKISAPLVEELPATGKTPYQLARDIEGELARYIRNPLVTVIVSGFVGPYSEQIRVVGEAANPQAVPYREHMTLLDLMIQVGGLTEFAAGNRATLVRWINGEQRQFNVRIDDLIEDGDITANVDMLPGDILIVPEAFF